MNLHLNPPRAAQAVRVRAPRKHPMAFFPPPAPVGFWRWAIRQVVCWSAVGLWFAAVGALIFAVGSS